MPVSVDGAQQAFDNLAKHATESRTAIEAYAHAYTGIGAATHELIHTQTDLSNVVDTIAQGLQLAGANGQQTTNVMAQLSQALAIGKLQWEDLKVILQASDAFAARLAKGMGMSLNEMIKKAQGQGGGIEAKKVIEGIRSIALATQEEFSKLPLTIGAASTIIANRWGVFINKINRESTAVTKVAKVFLSVFDKIEVGLADMVKFFGNSTQTVKFFGIAISAALAPLVFRTAAGAIAFLLSPMGLLLASLLILGLAIEDFYQWMNGGKSVFQQWFGNFDDAKKKLDEYSGWITAVKIAVTAAVGVMVLEWIWAAGVAVVSAGATALAWVGSLASFGIAMAANLVAVGVWVAGILIEVAVLLAGWVASFIAMAIAAAPVVLPILAIIAAIALVVAAVYYLYKNWDKVWTGIKDTAASVWDSVANGFGSMVEKLKGYWNSFKSFFGMKVDTTIGATGGTPVVTPTVAAGAAVSAGGVSGGNSSVVINQNLPPGTSAETAQAAKDATQTAIDKAFDVGRLSRQMGQVGG